MKKIIIALLAVTLGLNANAEDYTQFVKGDRVIGSITAPVTFIEYASMTCSHCANFDKNIVKKLKEEYVDTGKVAYALRAFPLDKLAFAVSKIQRCVPKDNFYTYVEAYFATQAEWARSQNPLEAIKKIAQIGGMTGEQVEACILDEKLQQEILDMRQSGIALGVRGTPTIFINGKKYQVSKYEQVKAIIESELNQ